MSAVLLQSKTGTGTSPTTTITWTKNTTAGSLILVVISGQGILTSSATDSQTNTYTQIDTMSPSAKTVDLLYSPNITAGTTPTITITTSSIFATTVCIQEWAGLLAAPLDIHSHTASSTTGTVLDSGASASMSVANELVVGWGMVENTGIITAGAGFSNLTTSSTNQETFLESMVARGLDSGLHTTATSSLSAPWGIGLVTFEIIPNALRVAGIRPHPFSPGIAR